MAAAGQRTAWDDVPAGLREAQHVADAVADSSDALELPAVVRLKDVHLRGLIRLLRDDPQVQSFAERELDGLLCAADEGLLAVLRTYLATGRNKSRTAQLHHVSRPALYRRLEAIEGLARGGPRRLRTGRIGAHRAPRARRATGVKHGTTWENGGETCAHTRVTPWNAAPPQT